MRTGILSLGMLVLLMLSGAMAGNGGGESAGINDPSVITLYLSSQGGLSESPPENGDPSSMPILGAAGVVWRSVGTWRSEPIVGGIEIQGGANFTLFARSDLGIGSRAMFRMTVYANGDTASGSTITSDSQTLGAHATEYNAEGEIALSLAEGDTITINVEAAVTGGRGAMLFWSSPTPSSISLGGEACMVWVDMPTAQKGRMESRAEAYHIWGPGHIETVNAYALGPFKERQFDMDPLQMISQGELVAGSGTIEDMEVDSSNTSMLVTWVWDHGRVKAGEGNYYIVFVAETSSGTQYFGRGIGTVVQEEDALFGSPLVLMVVFIAIGAMAAGAYFMAVRSDRLASKNTKILALGVTALIVVGSGIGAFQAGSELFTGKEEAPDFTVKDVDGGTFTLSEHRGEVIIIDLMATWCPSCNALMPELRQVSKDHPDAVIVTIDVDASETESTLRSFKEKYDADWHFAMDTDGVMTKYSVTYIPRLVIVNPQGYIAFTHIGELSSKEIGAQVEKAYSGGVEEATAQVGDLRVLAFAVGMLSFFAPCAFPLLPGYFTYYLGRPIKQGRRDEEVEEVPEGKVELIETGKGEGARGAAVGGLAAAMGIFSVFALVGLLVATAGGEVSRYMLYVSPIVTAAIAVMGVIMLLDIEIPFHRLTSGLPGRATVEKGFERVLGKQEDRGRHSGLFAYGAAYGMASMGCQAPVFIALILAAFFAGGFMNALLIFVLFGIGMALMMVMVTVLVGKAKDRVIARLRRLMPVMKRLSGLILVVAGIYLTYEYLLVL